MSYTIPAAMQEFLAAYPHKIELHAHTWPVSGCSQIPPKDMIRLMKENGYSAVVIANHFKNDSSFHNTEDPAGTYLADYYATKEEGDKEGIKVYMGAEYTFANDPNHYLVFGVDEPFIRETVGRLDMGIEQFYREYHCQDRLIIQAHPDRDGQKKIPPEYLDGMEIINLHPHHNSRVTLSTHYAQEQNFPVITIGSDLHNPPYAGLTALRTKEIPADEVALVHLLRSRDYLFDICGLPLFPFTRF